MANPFSDSNLGINEALSKSQEGGHEQNSRQDFFNKPAPLASGGKVGSFHQQEKPFNINDAFSKLDDVVKTTPAKSSPFDNNYITENQLPDSEKKSTGVYFPGVDNEERRARTQSTGEKWLYGTERGVVSLAKGVGDMVGLIADTGYALGNVVGATNQGFVNNDWNKTLTDWKTSFDASHPLYQTQAQKDSWLPDANTLPKLIDTVGSIAGIVLGSKGLGFLAKAAQLGALVDAIGGTIESSYMNKITGLSDISEKLATIRESGQPVTQPIIDAVNQAGVKTTMDSYENIAKAISQSKADIDKGYAFTKGAYTTGVQGVSRMVMNLGMASAMGYEGRKNYSEAMYSKIRSEQGREPTDDEKAKIEDYAQSVGTATTVITGLMGITTLSGLTDAVIGKSLFKNAAREELSEIFAKNASGEIGDVLDEKFTQAGSEGIEYTTKPKFSPTAEGKLGKFRQVAWDKTKSATKFVWDKFDIPAGFTMAEFGLVGNSVDNYYEKKYDNPDASVWSDAILPNLKGLASSEGLSTIIMGALGTMPFELSHKMSEAKLKNEKTQEIIKALNDPKTRSAYLDNLKSSFNRMSGINRKIIESRKYGEDKSANDAMEQSLQNYLYPRISAGMKPVVDKELEGFRKLAATDEGIQELKSKGYIPADVDSKVARENFLEHLKTIEQKVTNSENYFKGLKAQLGYNPNFKPEHYEQLMYLSGMTDDATSRIKTLYDELLNSKLKDATVEPGKEGFSANQILQRLYPLLTRVTPQAEMIKQGLSEINEHLSQLPINDTEKAAIDQKLADMVELSFDRNKYLEDYNSILRNPKGHENIVKEPVSIGDKENVIQGTKLAPTKTANTNPVQFEVGKEYYSGSTILPGKTEDGRTSRFLKFQQFKVVGEETVDGKRKIIVESNGNTFSVPEETFSKYKIGSVDTLNKPENRNAKFWFNNRNKVFEFDMGKGRKPEGRLRYDPDTDKFSFVYYEKDENGRTTEKVTEVTTDKFRDQVFTDKNGGVVSTRAKIRKVDEVTEADKEFLEAKETEKEQKERLFKAEQKLDVISKLIEDKKAIVKDIEDTILDHEITIEQTRKELDELQKNAENYPQRENKGELTKDTKKFVGTTINSIKDLHGIIRNSEEHIQTLQKSVDELNDEIADLDSIDISSLPDGRGLLQFFKENKSNLENITLDIGKKINTLSDFINTTKELLSSALDRFSGFLERFSRKYPDVAINRSNLDRFKSDLNSNIDNARFVVGDNNSFIDDLTDMSKAIRESEELEVPVKESAIKQASDEIDKLYDQLQGVNRQMKLNKELYDAFQKKLKEWKKEQNKRKLLESPEMRQKLAALQGVTMNRAYGDNTPDTDASTPVVYESPAKPITKVHLSSVQLPEHVPDNNFFQKRTNQFTKNVNIDFSKVEKEHGQKYVQDDPDFKSKMRVIVVTRQNQNHYFPDSSPLIAESYSFNGETVHNTTNTDKASVAYVHVYDDGKQDWFIDQNGKLLSPIGDKNADPNQVIYQLMETAGTDVRQSGYKKAYIPEGMTDEEIRLYNDRAKTERKRIVQNTEPSKFYPYEESVGIGNYEIVDGKRKVIRNSVDDANIIPNDKIGAGSITIPTEKAGNRIQVGNNLVPGSAGRPMIIHNNNIAYIDGKRIGEGGEHEVNLLYSILKAASQSRETELLDKNGKRSIGNIDNRYTDHLRKVLFFSDKGANKPEGVSNNQMYFDGGSLAFKLNGELKYIPFIADEIDANQELIKEWLKQSIHTVATGDLGKPFYEITKVNYDAKGKLIDPTTTKWENYEQYLLSNKTPDGADRSAIPMTVSIKAGADEVPFKNKYITPNFHGEYFPDVKIETPVEETKEQNANKPENTTGKSIEYKGQQVSIDGKKPTVIETPDKHSIEYTAIEKNGKIDVTVNKILSPEKDDVTELQADKKAKYEETLSKKLTEEFVKQKPVEQPKVEIVGNKEYVESLPKDKVIEIKEPTFIAEKQSAADFLQSLTGNSSGNVDLMEVSPLDIIEKTDNPAEVRSFIESQIPQIKFEELPEFIKAGNGTMAYGAYQDHYIQLYKGAPEGTGMHEIYHAVEDSFLNNKEIAQTRDEFRSRTGSYTDRFGKEIKYSEATERDVREKLAEEFKSFAKQNPDYTPGTKIGNFFKRLYNFIKHVVLGNPTKINDIFKRINSGYYRDAKFVQKPISEPDYSAMKGFSELEKKNVLHGLYNRIIDNLERSNGGIMRLTDGDITEKQVFDTVFNTMNDYYSKEKATDNSVQSNIWKRGAGRVKAVQESNLSPEQKDVAIKMIANEAEGAFKTWEKVTAQKDNVIEDLKDYMKKYKLVFEKSKGTKPEDAENESKANSEEEKDYHLGIEEDDKDRGYETNTLAYDAKENAHLAVKLLFSNLVATEEASSSNQLARFGRDTLTQPASKLSHMLLPEIVPGSQYMNKVLDEMAGLTKPEDIQKKLFDMAKQDPALVKLYNSVYKEPKNEDDWKLRVAFTTFSSKVKADPWYMEIDENGNTIIKNSNLDSDAHNLVTQWESDLRGDNTGVVTVQDNLYKADTKKLINPSIGGETKRWENTKKLLQQLKFPVENIHRLSEADKKTLMSETNTLYNRLKDGLQYKEISAKSLDTSAIGKIARLLSKSFPVSGATARTNMDGNKVMNHVLHNTLTRMFSDINNVSHLDQLPSRYLNDTWVKNSQLLKKGGQLFDATGAKIKGATLNMSVIDGLYNKSNNTRSPRIGMGNTNLAVRFMINMNMNLEGIYSFFIAADSQTEAGVKVKNYVSAESLKTGNHYKEFNNIASGYLADEIDLIKENLSGSRKLLSGAVENDNFKKLQIFKDVLSKELSDKIAKYANEPNDITTEDFIKSIKEEFNNDLKTYLDKSTETQKKFLEDSLILDFKQLSGKYTLHGLNSEFLSSVGLKGNKTFTPEQIDNILTYRGMNLFAHNTEMRKLFHGPWYEVPDAPKRDKTSQSGTISTYTEDENFNRWHNQNQRSGDVSVNPGDFGYRNHVDNFRQLTVAEPQTQSAVYDQLHKAIGDLAKPYKNIDEMDAQGITLDTAWKEYKLRSGDRWNSEDEKQHQYDMAVARKAHYEREGIDAKKYRSELKEADNKIIEQGNPNTKAIGTPLKPLGSGMQMSDTQSMPYLDKTSIFRLSYPIAKDRGLEDLYWFMHDNNISIVGPKSFQKFGRTYMNDLKSTDGLQPLYKDGKIDLTSLSVDSVNRSAIDIPWKTFNKIVETAKSKEGRTRGTQILSLATVNTHASGLPIDFWNPEKDDLKLKQEEWNQLSPEQKRKQSDFHALKEDNNRAIVERSQRGYEDTLKSLGITDHGGSYSFNDPAKLVDYLKNEITRRDLPDNVASGLQWDINPSTGEEYLVNPLESMANYQELNNLIWSLGTKNILKPRMNGTDNILVSSTGFEKKGIKRVETKNGKSVMVSSELKYYEKGKGENGKTSLVQVYAPNHLAAELKKQGSKLTDEQLFKYLNTKEGKELLQAVGFRIPTQGLNSMDAIEIVPWDTENNQFFIPAEMGNSIIVPSELVTKVGLDFDVDKMPTYHYNFYVDKDGYPRKVEFKTDENSTVEERFIDFVSNHPNNKGDLKALKNSSEYSEMESSMDAMYSEAKSEVGEINKQAKTTKDALKSRLQSIADSSESVYEKGFQIFKTLPVSIRQLYYSTEAGLSTDGKLKGLTKIQFYHQMASGLIEAVNEKLAKGVKTENYNYEYTDKKTKKKETDAESVDLGQLKDILETLAENSKEVLQYNQVLSESLDNYKILKERIRNNFLEGKDNIFSDLKENQKEQFKEWLLEASKVIAEGRGIKSIEAFGKGDLFTQNSTEAIENKYVDTLKDLITHPDNYNQLITPNSSDELVGIFKSISNKLNPEKANRGKKDVNYSNLLDPMYLNQERQDYRDATGKSIGIVAQNNTFHALSQLAYIPIDTEGLKHVTPEERKLLGDMKIYLPHQQVNYGGEKKTVLSGYKNNKGNLISDFISQLINGAVDAVKDKWMIELLQQKDLLSMATFLGRTGVDPEYVFNFINQPIIQEYVRQENIRRDVRLLNPGVEKLYRDDLIKLLNTQMGLKSRVPKRDSNFSLTELGNVLSATGEGKKLGGLTQEQKELQSQVLGEYLKYRTMTDHMLQEQLGLLTGNMQRLNENAINLKTKRGEKAKTKSSIGAVRKLDGNTYNNEILDIANKFNDAKNEITPISGHSALDEIKKQFSNPDLFVKDIVREKAVNKATLSFIDYATQVKSGINEDIKSTLFDGTNVANLLTKERSAAKGGLKDLLNKVLGNLRGTTGIKANGIKSVELTSKPATGVESDILTEAFRTLRDNPATNHLYKELVTASFLQSGLQNTSGSYHKLLPNEDVMNFMKPIIDKMLMDDMESFNKTNSFYRNNWSDKDIVPVARKDDRINPDHHTYSFKRLGQTNKLVERMNEVLAKNGMEFPKFLQRNEIFDKIDLAYEVIQFSEENKKSDGTFYTKEEKEKMARMGDYSFNRTGLLQKVYGSDGKPLKGKDSNDGTKNFIYKQINTWGDGNKLQEHYDQPQPSILDKHQRIFEISDGYVEKMVNNQMTSYDLETMKNEYLSVPSSEESQESIEPKVTADTKTVAKQNEEPGNMPTKPCK